MIGQQMLIRVQWAAILVLVVAGAWGWTLAVTRGARADVAEVRQEAAGAAAQVAEQHTANCASYNQQLVAIQRECDAAKRTLTEQNAAAVKAARAAGVQAGVEQERYAQSLEDAAADDACDDILEAKVCPALMGY
jgi:hypothetical protein